MSSEISVDSFLKLLRQSGLLSDEPMLALTAECKSPQVQQDGAHKLAEELIRRNVLTQWQADMLLQGKHRGFRLGVHRILRPLGHGGMSKVFLAEHEVMRRRCAIKVLPSKYQDDPDLLGRFHLEARAIAALDHPHIVRAYDFNKDVRYGKEIHYLVMEYVEGQDLRRMVEEQGPLDYRKAADLIRQAAEGLAHAHELGFVHRDIKPANLLVDPNGVLKILDLGLARFTFEGEQPWQTPEGEQSAVGTADYVAPEQVMDSRNVDGRADIYSLGHTFYFLLTGRRPFPKATLVELLKAHQSEKPEPIQKLRPDVPLELSDIFDRMTAKKPPQRFQSAQEVADTLKSWLRNSSSSGEFSRISALMAAAMRAKQPAAGDTPTQSNRATQEDLELALVEDEPVSNAGESRHAATPPAAAREPEVATKTPPTLDQEKKPLRPKVDGLVRAQALPEFAVEDLILVDEEMAMAGDQAQPVQVLQPSFRRRNAWESLIRSPWVWLALGGVGFVIVLLVLIFSLARREIPEEPRLNDGAPPQSDHAEPRSSAKLPEPAPEQPAAPPKPPTESPSVPSESEMPSLPPVQIGPPSPSAPSEKPSPPIQDHSTPAKPPPVKLDANKLAAGMTTLSLRFQSFDRDPNSKLNLMVKRQFAETAQQLNLPIGTGGFPVLDVELRSVNAGELANVVLSASLKCRIPDGRIAIVWQQTQTLASLPLRRTSPELAIKALRPAVSKFFNQFAEDIRRARTIAQSQ